MQSGPHRLQLPPHRCPPQQRRRRRDRPGWGRKKPASAPTSCLNVLPTTRHHPLPRPGELPLLGPEARRVHAGPELQGLRHYVQVPINIKRCKPQTLSLRGLGNSQLIHALLGRATLALACHCCVLTPGVSEISSRCKRHHKLPHRVGGSSKLKKCPTVCAVTGWLQALQFAHAIYPTCHHRFQGLRLNTTCVAQDPAGPLGLQECMVVSQN